MKSVRAASDDYLVFYPDVGKGVRRSRPCKSITCSCYSPKTLIFPCVSRYPRTPGPRTEGLGVKEGPVGGLERGLKTERGRGSGKEKKGPRKGVSLESVGK